MKSFIQNFLATTAPSTFVILISQPFHLPRVEEFNLENATTSEQLTLRNGHFKKAINGKILFNYVEIMRHPKGANAKMREWLMQRAYYEKKYNKDNKEMQVISIGWLNIG